MAYTPIEALKQIEQMSDPGSPEIAVVRMKSIATEALKLAAQPKHEILNNPTIESIKNKYKSYISNIEWDTRVNARRGKEKEDNDEQVKYYLEFLSDLRILQ